MSTKNPKIIECETEVGTYRSFDGGKNWSFCLTMNIDRETAQPIIHDLNGMRYMSFDNGQNWTK